MDEGSGGKGIRVGILSEIHSLDPLRAQDMDSLFVLRQIVESPYQVRPGGIDLEPTLFAEALRLEPGSDPQVYRARVREGLEFSDGKPLDARLVPATKPGSTQRATRSSSPSPSLTPAST